MFVYRACVDTKFPGGRRLRLSEREDITWYPETRDRGCDMRSGHCNGDRRSSCWCQVPPRQHQWNCHGIYLSHLAVCRKIVFLSHPNFINPQRLRIPEHTGGASGVARNLRQGVRKAVLLPPLFSPSFPSLSFPLLRSRHPWGSGESCKLPQRGLGRNSSGNWIWCILALKSDIWWHQFYDRARAGFT